MKQSHKKCQSTVKLWSVINVPEKMKLLHFREMRLRLKIRNNKSEKKMKYMRLLMEYPDAHDESDS